MSGFKVSRVYCKFKNNVRLLMRVKQLTPANFPKFKECLLMAEKILDDFCTEVDETITYDEFEEIQKCKEHLKKVLFNNLKHRWCIIVEKGNCNKEFLNFTQCIYELDVATGFLEKDTKKVKMVGKALEKLLSA